MTFNSVYANEMGVVKKEATTSAYDKTKNQVRIRLCTTQ